MKVGDLVEQTSGTRPPYRKLHKYRKHGRIIRKGTTFDFYNWSTRGRHFLVFFDHRIPMFPPRRAWLYEDDLKLVNGLEGLAHSVDR